MGVLTGIGVFNPLFNVLNRNESLEFKLFVDHRQFFDPVLMQNLAGLFQAGPSGGGNEFVALHHLGNLQIHSPRLEAQVTIRENVDQLPGLGDRNTGN